MPLEPLLTIAIPYYRNAAFLDRAIASALAQTEPRFRLIISDAGGLPDARVRKLVEDRNDSRILYSPAGRALGIAEHWNRCLELAQTDLVTLLHDDDELLPDYAAEMIAAAGGYPGAAILFCEAAVIGDDGQRKFSMPDFVKKFLRPKPGRTIVLHGEHGLRTLMRGNYIMCPTMCYRKSKLAGRRFSDRWRQVLDLDFISGILMEGGRIIGIPRTLYLYRRHANNTTAVQTETLLRYHEEIAIHDEVAKAARGKGLRQAAESAEMKSLVMLNLIYRIASDLSGGRFRAARMKYELLQGLMAGD